MFCWHIRFLHVAILINKFLACITKKLSILGLFSWLKRFDKSLMLLVQIDSQLGGLFENLKSKFAGSVPARQLKPIVQLVYTRTNCQTTARARSNQGDQICLFYRAQMAILGTFPWEKMLIGHYFLVNEWWFIFGTLGA